MPVLGEAASTDAASIIDELVKRVQAVVRPQEWGSNTMFNLTFEDVKDVAEKMKREYYFEEWRAAKTKAISS